MQEFIVSNTQLSQDLAAATTRVRFVLQPGKETLGYFVPVALYDVDREAVSHEALKQLGCDQLNAYGGLTEATTFLDEAHRELGTFVPETEIDVMNGRRAVDSFGHQSMVAIL